jgi:hypothetical protein
MTAHFACCILVTSYTVITYRNEYEEILDGHNPVQGVDIIPALLSIALRILQSIHGFYSIFGKHHNLIASSTFFSAIKIYNQPSDSQAHMVLTRVEDQELLKLESL